jgi:hypothetical protein
MKNRKAALGLLGVFFVLAITTQSARSQEKATAGTVQVHMVITDAALRDDAELPRLQQQDVKVKQGRNFLQDPTDSCPGRERSAPVDDSD